MKLYILYKLLNRVTNRVYFGLHLTTDLDYGTNVAIDKYVPEIDEIRDCIKAYGYNAIHVTPIHAFLDETEARRVLSNHVLAAGENTYNALLTQARSASMKGNKNALGYKATEETRRRMSEVKLKERNPLYGKRHKESTLNVMSTFRSSMMWICNGSEERQVLKTDPVPDGWFKGRKKAQRRSRRKNTQV